MFHCYRILTACTDIEPRVICCPPSHVQTVPLPPSRPSDISALHSFHTSRSSNWKSPSSTASHLVRSHTHSGFIPVSVRSHGGLRGHTLLHPQRAEEFEPLQSRYAGFLEPALVSIHPCQPFPRSPTPRHRCRLSLDEQLRSRQANRLDLVPLILRRHVRCIDRSFSLTTFSTALLPSVWFGPSSLVPAAFSAEVDGATSALQSTLLVIQRSL